MESFTQGENWVSRKHMLGESLRDNSDNSLHLTSIEIVVSGWCEDKQEEDGKFKILYY